MSFEQEPSLYEIVELEDGEVVLRKSGDTESTPLVSIKFSDESMYYLDQARFEVAKAMIEAGLDAVADINEEDETEELDEHSPKSTLIH